MSTQIRSATKLVEMAMARPETLEALSKSPEATLKSLERDVLSALPPPPPEMVGRLWLIIVATFALVLLYTAWILGQGVTTPLVKDVTYAFTGASMLTVFTTVLGFLAGLLTPSPMGGQTR